MSTQAATPFHATHPDERGATPTRQVGALVRRNLTHIKRQPAMLTDVTIQPVMFVLLFVYVFGGAIEVISTPGAGTMITGTIPLPTEA